MAAKRDPRLTTFGARVALLRRARKLTQEQVAEKADVNVQYVSEIERGIVNPSLLVLQGLASALGLSLARLMAEPGEAEHEIVALLAGRSREERERVLRVVRAVVSTDPVSPR